MRSLRSRCRRHTESFRLQNMRRVWYLPNLFCISGWSTSTANLPKETKCAYPFKTTKTRARPGYNLLARKSVKRSYEKAIFFSKKTFIRLRDESFLLMISFPAKTPRLWGIQTPASFNHVVSYRNSLSNVESGNISVSCRVSFGKARYC